ncbi:MAG: carbohydrate ABC transporter permease [Roseburia sp.]|nr:carbohydrate ABC transporter permease [Anaeroplasma bactoclasticum]MCM1196306.1 carbohydrate ABC transporter permease [Roseburia sp.]MCM1557172.1 carbohydrate ABC transporter permease [Anaeroplasma bactoclasticum]
MKDKNKVIRNIFIYILLSVWAILVIFPFFWMILTSFKTYSAYNSETTPQFFVLKPTFDNYISAWTVAKLGQYMLNTIIFSITTTLLMVFVSLLAAFAFARLDFKGKNIVFVLFLAMMMVPNELVIITNYVSIVNLDWRNTFTGLILPSILSVFYIYLLRQNFMQVSDDVYFAAKVDGTSDFKYLWKILVPLSKPTIITITILKLIECWNSYVWPRLITTDKDFYLVSNGIQLIKEQSMGKADIPGMMAAVVCVSLPLLLLFIAFRKQIMSGVARSGSKG